MDINYITDEERSQLPSGVVITESRSRATVTVQGKSYTLAKKWLKFIDGVPFESDTTDGFEQCARVAEES